LQIDFILELGSVIAIGIGQEENWGSERRRKARVIRKIWDRGKIS
jgi:hypothetical protein